MTTIEETQVSMQDVMGAAMRFQAAADVVAALGARLGEDSDALPPEVAAAIDDVLAAAGLTGLDQLAPPQRAMIAGMARTMFGQAADLLHNAVRPAGWTYTNVAVLEGQGRASMAVPGLLAATGEFGDVTSFLDVGTGVGWLAVAAAQVWPNADIVGVDVWEPALQRARANIAGAGLDRRVEIRGQSIADLNDSERFDLTWVPSFFLSTEVLTPGLERILAATRPGGRVAVGRYEPPPDPIVRTTQRLRTVRDGGAILNADEVVEFLAAAGWSDVRPLPRTGSVPLQFVTGRRA